MGKIHDVFQRIKDPADRAEMARRFGVTLTSTGEPCASLDPPRRGAGPAADAEAKFQAMIRSDVEKFGLSVPEDDSPESAEAPATPFERIVEADRRRFGLA